MMGNPDHRLYQLAMIREREIAEGAERKRLLNAVPNAGASGSALQAFLEEAKSMVAHLSLRWAHPRQASDH